MAKLTSATSSGSAPKTSKPVLGKAMDVVMLAVLCLFLLASVIVITQSANLAHRSSSRKQQLNSFSKLGGSTTLSVVRALQGVLSAIVTTILNDAFVLLHWSLACSPQGLPYLSLLALSPTTSISGVVSLLASSAPRLGTKAWAVVRISLTLLVWVSGLLLFFQTSSITVYDIAASYKVIAGVGSFNGSLVRPFINYLRPSGYPFEILPFTYYAAVYVLVLNPLISTIATPIQCHGDDCISYLLSGGLEMVAPWSPSGSSNYGMVKIDSAPSVQMDFSSPSSDIFSADECDIIGQSGVDIGIRFCVARDELVDGGLQAALFVCSNGIDDGACDLGITMPNITTRVSFYTRQATIVASRANYSIVSVASTSDAIPVPHIDLPAYREAILWLLNYTAAGIPAPSSIAQSFWSSGPQLSRPTTFGILEQNFQSIIAFPFWLFNSNNWANPALQADKLIDGMPPQFYTTASVVQPYVKTQFSSVMVLAFLIIQGVAIFFTLGVSLWLCCGKSRLVPRISPYPIFDISHKAVVEGNAHIGDARRIKTAEIVPAMKYSVVSSG